MKSIQQLEDEIADIISRAQRAQWHLSEYKTLEPHLLRAKRETKESIRRDLTEICLTAAGLISVLRREE